MIVHNNIDIPSLEERWDPSDQRFINIAWDNVLNGRTIVSSTWIVPTGWTKGTEQISQTVTDDEGNTYTAVNRVYLSTVQVRGAYTINNRVVLSGASPGEQFNRSVRIHVGAL